MAKGKAAKRKASLQTPLELERARNEALQRQRTQAAKAARPADEAHRKAYQKRIAEAQAKVDDHNVGYRPPESHVKIEKNGKKLWGKARSALLLGAFRSGGRFAPVAPSGASTAPVGGRASRSDSRGDPSSDDGPPALESRLSSLASVQEAMHDLAKAVRRVQEVISLKPGQRTSRVEWSSRASEGADEASELGGGASSTLRRNQLSSRFVRWRSRKGGDEAGDGDRSSSGGASSHGSGLTRSRRNMFSFRASRVSRRSFGAAGGSPRGGGSSREGGAGGGAAGDGGGGGGAVGFGAAGVGGAGSSEGISPVKSFRWSRFAGGSSERDSTRDSTRDDGGGSNRLGSGSFMKRSGKRTTDDAASKNHYWAWAGSGRFGGSPDPRRRNWERKIVCNGSAPSAATSAAPQPEARKGGRFARPRRTPIAPPPLSSAQMGALEKPQPLACAGTISSDAASVAMGQGFGAIR